MPPTINKPGPPKAKIDHAVVEQLASIGCTLQEIAAVVGLSRRTLTRREKDPAFIEAIESGRAKGRASLRRMQWTAATAGNVTAQIWLGKQLLGQRSFDKFEPEVQAKPDKVIYQWVSPSSEVSPGTSSISPSPASTDSTP